MLVIKKKDLYRKAKRLRWFGIDREKRKKAFGKMILSKLDINTK